MAKTQDSGMTPDTELFCVVASTGVGKQVAPGQIPATCDPGTYSTAQVRCNTKICSRMTVAPSIATASNP